MLLTVGELARRSGLTVRALHHYHRKGLLEPSARSPAGYRLYDRDDVARLHAIQSLRALGVPLKQIGSMLAGDGSDLPSIVARQLRALDSQIAQATALRQRLALLKEMLAAGRQPEVDDWLGTIGMMNTYARYFSTDEIALIVRNWPRVAEPWRQVVAQLRAALSQGLPAGDPQVQALAQQWMGLLHRWLDGDFELMRRWGDLYAVEPQAHGRDGTDLALMRYVEQATQPRMAMWQQFFSLEEMSRFSPLADADVQGLASDVLVALERRVALDGPEARALLQRWQDKLMQAVGGDAGLARRLRRAYQDQPALRTGSKLPQAALDFLLAVAQHAEVA